MCKLKEQSLFQDEATANSNTGTSIAESGF